MGYREKCLRAKEKSCLICGSEKEIHVHHVDGDRSNNSLENLIPVCQSCHIQIHKDNERLCEWTEKLDEEKIGSGDPTVTSLKLPERRKRLFRDAEEVISRKWSTDPARSEIIDAALTHLIESEENLDEARGKYPPGTVKDCCNTEVLKLRYRTSVESGWRK